MTQETNKDTEQTKTWHARAETNNTQTWRMRQEGKEDRRNKNRTYETRNTLTWHTHDTWQKKQTKLWHMTLWCSTVLEGVAVCCSLHKIQETNQNMTHDTPHTVVFDCSWVRCSVLQCVAVCCSVLQCVAAYMYQLFNTKSSVAPLFKTHDTQPFVVLVCFWRWIVIMENATHCNTLQHTATHCNTLQHPATPCNTLQHPATHCNTLQLEDRWFSWRI